MAPGGYGMLGGSPDPGNVREALELEKNEPPGEVPPSPLWAMKFKRHIQWHLLPEHDRHDQVRDCIGSGQETVYAIDDGRHHFMLGHRVGATGDGCEYSLVGRVTRDHYDDLREHRLALAQAFNGATDLALCGEVNPDDDRTAAVLDVDRYASIEEVPAEYLPGAPFIDFAEALEITTY